MPRLRDAQCARFRLSCTKTAYFVFQTQSVTTEKEAQFQKKIRKDLRISKQSSTFASRLSW